SAQIREILISESAWEEMTCLFAPSLVRVEAGPESAKKKPTQQSRRRTNQLCYAVIQKRK
ncbi:hypothetical protein LVV79_23185, partial [Klebsiella pneumoniae]|nr:hypothetical protein [Klebsiella pneumoniae]MDC8473166.1 hypothetical protein [Klebsiella pneumoniae]